MKLFHPFLLFALLTAGTLVQAQTVHIYHDLVKDSTWHKIEGKRKTVVKPGIPLLQKGTTVQLHLLEYNDFLYDISIERQVVESVSPTATTSSSATSLTNSLVSMLGAGLGGRSGISPLSAAPNFISRLATIRGQLEGGRGGDPNELVRGIDQKSADLAIWAEDAMTSMDALDKILSATSQLEDKLIEDAKVIREVSFLKEELKQLALIPSLPPSQLVALADELMDRSFGSKGAQLDVNTVLALDLSSQLREYEQRLVTYTSETQGHYRTLKVLGYNIKNEIAAYPQYKPVADACSDISDEKVVLTKLADATNYLKQLQKEAESVGRPELLSIFSQYQAIRNHTFTKHHQLYVEGNAMDVVVKLKPRKAASAPDNQTSRGEGSPLGGNGEELMEWGTKLRVNAYDPIRFSTNMGFAFSNFFKPEQLYAVRDNQIVVDQEELIRPLLVTGISIYSGKDSRLSPGFNLGVGLPVLSNNEGPSLSYIIGPSLVIGRAHGLVLNAGLLGGKVQRLRAPYRVNDSYTGTTQELATEFRFGYGWFIGASMNLP